jgi:hypothetical protein
MSSLDSGGVKNPKKRFHGGCCGVKCMEKYKNTTPEKGATRCKVVM